MWHQIVGAFSNAVRNPQPAGGAFSVTFTSNQDEASAATPTITYTSVPIGTANANRVVVVATAIRYTTTQPGVIAVSIGGNAATQVTGALTTGAALEANIWFLAVAAGTTADIVLTVGLNTRTAISVWSVITTTPTPSAGANNYDASNTSVSATIAVPASGGGVGMYLENATNTGDVAWTNATNSFVAVNNWGGSTTTYDGASLTAGASSVSATMGGTAVQVISAAAWSP